MAHLIYTYKEIEMDYVLNIHGIFINKTLIFLNNQLKQQGVDFYLKSV